jgi:Flp pilus assembly protein TadD
MESPNFEMYTTTGDRSARDTLRFFEQIHSFFAQTMPTALGKPLPVRIVAFSSAKEYEPYRFNSFAVAYYHSTPDCDYIVMSHTGSETFPVAIHEYTHLVVQHSHLNLPPWLNEGVAELYSTLRPLGDKILVGALIPGRHQALLTDKWVPLATILSADRDSPYYNEKNKAGSLYNEGWALTHMLALDNQYRAQFSAVMRSISAGTPSRDALEQIYKKPLAAIEKDLMGYLRGGSFQGVLIPAKLLKISDDLQGEAANPFEVKLLLTRLTDLPANTESTQNALKSLIAEDPKRPEPHVDLGYLLWRTKNDREAREEFARAYELGSRSPRLLWDYGRMEESHDAAAAIRAFNELLPQDPDRLEVRLELAAMQLNARAAKDAIETLKPVKRVGPDDAPRLLILLAYANLEAGDRVTARNAADQLKKVAQTPEQKDTADKVLQFIASQSLTPATPPAVSRSADSRSVVSRSDDAPPRIQRREGPPGSVETITPAVQRPSFSGTFLELQCADPAKIVIQTAEGRKVVMIDDPNRLLVNGHNGEKMDLTCGPQKPVKVRVEYDPPATPGVDGRVRAIYFD